MDITIFLAQIWGPVLFAVGLGIFVSRRHYLEVYRGLDKETMAVFTFSVMSIALGIVQISAHNVWDTLPQTVISLLGFGLLIKGLMFAIAPRMADRGGEWMAGSNMISLVGTAMLILGAYLSWFAYFA